MLLTHRKRNVRVWRFWRPGCPVNGRQKQAATRRVRRVNSEPSLPTPDPWFEEDDLQTACYRCLGCKILNQGREMNRILSGRILFNVIRHRTWRVGLQFQLYEALQIFSPASLAAKTISYFQWCLPFMIAAWCCLRLGSEEPRWHGQQNGCLPNRSRKCLLQDFDIRCFPKSLHCLSITKFRCRGQHQNMSLFFCFALATCRVILCHSMERSPPLPCTMFFFTCFALPEWMLQAGRCPKGHRLQSLGSISHPQPAAANVNLQQNFMGTVWKWTGSARYRFTLVMVWDYQTNN